MDNFETVLTEKIDKLEVNFDQLNQKVDNLQNEWIFIKVIQKL